MKVGDLVCLNPIHFSEHYDCFGLIVEIDKNNTMGYYKVVWTDDQNGFETGWFHERELEII